jgi:hypothetical protein
LDGVVLGRSGPARPAGLAWRAGLADGPLGLPAGPLGLVLGRAGLAAGPLGLVPGLGGANAGAGMVARAPWVSPCQAAGSCQPGSAIATACPPPYWAICRVLYWGICPVAYWAICPPLYWGICPPPPGPMFSALGVGEAGTA